LRCIGSTTHEEMRTHILRDKAFARRFQKIDVGELSVEDTFAVLKGLRTHYEAHHNVQYSDSALLAAATLAGRFLNDRRLPDKAIDLVDEAGASMRLRAAKLGKSDQKMRVTTRDIERVLAKMPRFRSGRSIATIARRCRICRAS